MKILKILFCSSVFIQQIGSRADCWEFLWECDSCFRNNFLLSIESRDDCGEFLLLISFFLSFVGGEYPTESLDWVDGAHASEKNSQISLLLPILHSRLSRKLTDENFYGIETIVVASPLSRCSCSKVTSIANMTVQIGSRANCWEFLHLMKILKCHLAIEVTRQNFHQKFRCSFSKGTSIDSFT